MSDNIFVLGLDELNLETLRRLPGAEDYRFHHLLDIAEFRREQVDLGALLDRACAELESFGGSIDAIVGYWDFPTSSMVPILAERFGVRSAGLRSVVMCEHKYWSRLEQQKVIDEYLRFALVDLERDRTLPASLRYPVWLKPVKSFSSALAFRVEDDREFARAVGEIRDGVGRVGEPFQRVLDHLDPLDVPAEVLAAGGQACLAEEAATGAQLTVEGYRFEGETHIYGAVDSVSYPDSSSFLRYQYPSTVPAHLLERAGDVCDRVVDHFGLDSTTFNIEFFADVDSDELTLLEVNPRHSQSHARLFEHVDGVPNHQCMVRLALGRDPDLPYREGRYRMAAKWFLRRFTDGVVRRSPTSGEVAQVEREVPGTTVDVIAREGDRLSELSGQDSYSYELADLHIGADSEPELVAKYERCVGALPFEFDE